MEIDYFPSLFTLLLTVLVSSSWGNMMLFSCWIHHHVHCVPAVAVWLGSVQWTFRAVLLKTKRQKRTVSQSVDIGYFWQPQFKTTVYYQAALAVSTFSIYTYQVNAIHTKKKKKRVRAKSRLQPGWGHCLRMSYAKVWRRCLVLIGLWHFSYTMK